MMYRNVFRRLLFPAACILALVSLIGCSSKPRDGEPVPQGLGGDAMAAAPIDMADFNQAMARQEQIEGSLVRGSVDLSSSTITYYTQASVSDASAPLAPENGPMEIVDHSPVGELPVEMRRPTIYVMFSHPVVPLAKLGEPMRDSPIMTVEPAVPGTYRWYGTRVLSFEPDDTLVGNPRYRVTVTGDVKSLGGKKLGKDFEFEFYTETLKAVNHYPGNSTDTAGWLREVPTAVARYAIVEFNQPVDPDHLAAGMTVTVGKSEVPFKLSRPDYPEELATRTDRAVLVTLKSDPPEDTQVTLTMRKGASPFKGYPTTAADQQLEYSTVTRFRYEDLRSYSYDLPRNNKAGALPVYARFSHQVAAGAEKLAWNVTLNGTAVTPVAVDLFGNTVRVNVNGAEPGDSIAIKAPEGVKDVYGRALSNAGASNTTVIPNANPFVSFPYSSFYHLEAAYPPKLVWEARNLDAMRLGMGEGDAANLIKSGAGAPALETVDMSSWKKNRVRYVIEDLAPYLNGKGFGTVLFNWEAVYQNQWSKSAYTQRDRFAVQVTDIGVTTRYAYNRVLVWANSLSTGKPLSGAAVSLERMSGGAEYKATTDRNGLAVIDLEPGQYRSMYEPTARAYHADIHITVSKGDDTAELFANSTHNVWSSSLYGHSYPQYVELTQQRILMFTDRGLYKPGEELALRGIHWKQTLSEFEPYSGPYSMQLDDPRDGTRIWSEQGTTTESGGFAHRFTLPEGLEPGSYRLEYHAGDTHSSVAFTVAQFRRLTFQVNSQVPQRPFYLGDEVAVDVNASYLAGGAMPSASYTYFWTRKPAGFTPPGTQWDKHVFGPGSWEGQRFLSNGEGNLSPSGHAQIKEKTDGQNASGSAYYYILETTVVDVDRQAIASTASVFVHPASFYLGVRFASPAADGWWSRFVSTGKDVKAEVALVDPDGRLWARDASLTARVTKGTWKHTEQQGVYGRVNTRWEYVEEEVETAEVKASGGKASWTFRPKDSGDYLISFEGKDPRGRLAKTSVRFYATGSSWVRNATETPSSIELIPDRTEYLPGQTARILVRSPLSDARYLLTVERQGIESQKIITISDGNPVIEIPITEDHVPVIYVALSSCTKREAPPTDYFEPDLGRPRGIFGIVGLKVSTVPVELDVDVTPLEGAYKPGSNAQVAVRVTHNGKPVANAELIVMAVDRGVLDLIDYHVPDPVAYFYDPSHFPLAVSGDDSRRLLLKPVTYDTSVLTGGGGEKPQERKDFRPLALFEPFARTDSRGMALVSFGLPDTLTTYRLTAVAINGNRLGHSEGELLVQNPINVRAALPRRFRNRDTAVAGVVIQNLTSVEQKVEVSAVSDLLRVDGESTKAVTVPAGGVYELPFLLAATTPGEGSITFTIRSAVLNERLTEKVTVERPLVKEAFSTVGSVARDQSVAQEGLSLPSRIAPGYGSLTVKLSSSLRPMIEPSIYRLLDGPDPWWGFYRYLTYSFACAYEGVGAPTVRSVQKELEARQLPGGGIYVGGWHWQPFLPDPYISLLEAHFLIFAKERGLELPDAPHQERLLDYLAGLKSQNGFSAYYHAYLAYVLTEAGRRDSAFLAKVEAYKDELGLGGYGLLAQAYLAAGDKDGARRVYLRSKNFMMIGTQTVDVKDSYEVTNYWSSLLAEMGIFLKNAYELGEDSGLVQRIAASMDRSERYFRTLNDDLWMLLGFVPLLDDEGTASGVATVSVGSAGAEFLKRELSAQEPRSEDTLQFADKPLADLPRDTVVPLDFNKQGDTPVYYTTILRYALPTETALPRDEGLEVNAVYETLDGQSVEPGNLALGETYRVRVNVASSKRRQRLELLVPVPNGVEIVDPTFVTTGSFANQGGTGSQTITRETVYGDTMDVEAEGYGYWDGDWYMYWYRPDYFALDNMMVYRWTDFYAGNREVTFLVRVTTPGIYPTPPVSASLEFEPEVFGRSGGMLFVIKP
ncbi:MAG: hypothetical protein KBB32_04255 [Spirochaetia bacterium]|nr:hypothetical protein [Spirochaetia bacterium]